MSERFLFVCPHFTDVAIAKFLSSCMSGGSHFWGFCVPIFLYILLVCLLHAGGALFLVFGVITYERDLFELVACLVMHRVVLSVCLLASIISVNWSHV